MREYLGLSQQYVADKTGIPRSAVSDIERGVRKVDSLELRKLARLYMYPVGYFFGEEEVDEEAGPRTGRRFPPARARRSDACLHEAGNQASDSVIRAGDFGN